MWDKEDNLPMNKSLQKTQIGRCGELLVQQRLLRLGIESAALTTDTGIDLVAYAPGQAAPVTIQVKTKLVPVSAGGRGHSALDWWVPEHCPAELVALVDLSEDRVWLLRMGEVAELAQQRSKRGLHLCMYCCARSDVRSRRTPFADDFDRFLLPGRATELFPSAPLTPSDVV
jgi:hypothetical protein